MTSGDRKPLQASVRQRLLNIANRDRVDFQQILTRYSLERLLFRLGRSPHRATFLLKGAFLFLAWQDDIARPTKDLDFLGHGSPEIDRLESLLLEILSTKVEDDGLDFLPETVQGAAIREASLYDGIRFKLTATLGNIRIPIQIDIGFGDAAGQHATELEYPTLLDQGPPRIMSYKPEFVIAEKLEAIVALGLINSRIKDYYDLWCLSNSMQIPHKDIIGAIRATFDVRGTEIPSDIPPGLSVDFADGPKSRAWNAFISRSELDGKNLQLEDILRELRTHYLPLLGGATRGA